MNAALLEAQERITALQAQHERAHADASQPDPSADTIATLQAEIEAAKADAYLNGKRADVSKLETQIVAARKKSAEANATREAAQAALPVLAGRIAQAEAELHRLTAQHHAAALDVELAGYQEALKEYNAAGRAIITALAKLNSRAHVIDLLSTRLARRSQELEFVIQLLVHPLRLPLEVREDTWFTVSAWDAVSEEARPLTAKRLAQLAADGIEVDGPTLVNAPEPSAPTAPVEPREVRIVVDGKAEDHGPRLVVAGLVESVTH